MKRISPSGVVAERPWNSVGPPAAERASARSAANSSSVSGSAAAAISAAASIPGSHARACSIPAGSSSVSVLVNCANWKARNTAHSRSGASRRVATTTRHIGQVACGRSRGVVANGIPRSRNER